MRSDLWHIFVCIVYLSLHRHIFLSFNWLYFCLSVNIYRLSVTPVSILKTVTVHFFNYVSIHQTFNLFSVLFLMLYINWIKSKVHCQIFSVHWKWKTTVEHFRHVLTYVMYIIGINLQICYILISILLK